MLLVGRVCTVLGAGCISNVAFVALASNLTFVVAAGVPKPENVCLGWPSNGISFVGIANVASLHEVLLMTMVLSSSSSTSPSRLL